MENLHLKFTKLTIVCALIFISCTERIKDDEEFKTYNNNSKVLNKSSFTEGDAAFQSLSILNYEKLNSYFGYGKNSSNSKINNQYPDYYGGAFINETGQLNVLIKGSINRYKKNITDIIGNQNVAFIECKNSYQELKNIMSTLNEFKQNPSNITISSNFNAFSLNDADNVVEVQLEDISDLKQKEFKKHVINNHKAIKFIKSIGSFQNQSSLQPGCIADKSATNYGSYSFGARRNSDGKLGMVSSGHVFPIGQNLYQNSILIGTCTNSITSG